MNALDAYQRAVRELLEGHAERRDVLERFAEVLADTVAVGGLIYVTGSGHGHMVAEEAFYRAGGLAAVHPLLVPGLMLHEGAVRSSALERLPGIAHEVVADAGIGAQDLLVVASNSGRNAYPIEAARSGRARGATVVALTSLTHVAQVSSRDPSGAKLPDVADLVVDTGVPYGDAAVAVGAEGLRVGPLSTIACVFALNAAIARATERLLARGAAPDVFASANTEGAEPLSPERLAYWRGRVRTL